jgi:hypothetical protein
MTRIRRVPGPSFPQEGAILTIKGDNAALTMKLSSNQQDGLIRSRANGRPQVLRLSPQTSNHSAPPQ